RQRAEIVVDQVVAAGHEGEIAVAAAVGAERDVHIGGGRRAERGQRHPSIVAECVRIPERGSTDYGPTPAAGALNAYPAAASARQSTGAVNRHAMRYIGADSVPMPRHSLTTAVAYAQSAEAPSATSTL